MAELLKYYDKRKIPRIALVGLPWTETNQITVAWELIFEQNELNEEAYF